MSKNLEKYYNTSDNTGRETISAFRFVFIDSLVVSLFYKTRVAMRFPVQITSSCIWVAIPAD